jgi:hypothetical protein
MDPNPTIDEVERLPPTFSTLRELFLRSGNRCMFPGCPAAMVNGEGDFIGQVCHIEAAKPGGERFNKDQTEDDRRHISNLMLMCYPHHIQTNNVSNYSATLLKEYKQLHEARFSDVAEKMERSMVHDITGPNTMQHPKKLRRFSDVLNWNHSAEELAGDLQEFQKFVDRLAKVPKSTRDVFRIIIERGNSDGNLPIPELELVVSISREELVTHLAVLERHMLTTEGDSSEFGQTQVRPWAARHGWNVAADLKEFSKRTGVPLASLIGDGLFEQLD